MSLPAGQEGRNERKAEVYEWIEVVTKGSTASGQTLFQITQTHKQNTLHLKNQWKWGWKFLLIYVTSRTVGVCSVSICFSLSLFLSFSLYEFCSVSSFILFPRLEWWCSMISWPQSNHIEGEDFTAFSFPSFTYHMVMCILVLPVKEEEETECVDMIHVWINLFTLLKEGKKRVK